MVSSTSRRSTVRGRPPGLAAGSSGSRIAHCASVRSVGYALPISSPSVGRRMDATVPQPTTPVTSTFPDRLLLLQQLHDLRLDLLGRGVEVRGRGRVPHPPAAAVEDHE